MARKYFASIVVVLFVGIIAVAAAESSHSAPADDQIGVWIKHLDDDDFQTREEATRKLVAAGSCAVEAVAQAAASDSQEVAWRAGVVLQQIGISGDEQTMAQVIRAMANLEKAGKRSFKDSGEDIVRRWRQHRDQRAVAAVRRLGGEVVDSSPDLMAGGFGGGFAPVIPLEAPVIVDFGGGFGAIPRADELRLEVAKDPEAEAAKTPPVDRPIKPVEVPKTPPVDLPAAHLKAEAPEKPAERKAEVIEAEAVARFAEELKKEGVDIQPLSLAIDNGHADPVRADDVDAADEDLDGPLDFPALDLPVIGEGAAAPAIPVFGGGFGGDVVHWTPSGSSSRLVRIGKQWKGDSKDLQLLQEVSGLETLELDDFDLDQDAIRQIARLKNLGRLHVQHSKFDREKLLALKRARPNLTIYATGKTLLGVSGQPHPDGFQITSVVAASAAQKAGIRVGDILTQTEGIKLTTVDELTIAIAHKNVGDPLAITLLRGGEKHQIAAILGPR